MAKLLKIGIAGCGAIGSSLAKTVVSDFTDKAQLTSIYDIDTEKAYQLATKFNKKIAFGDNSKVRFLSGFRKVFYTFLYHKKDLVALNLEDLIHKVDLVIEATKAEVAFEIARKTILVGRDIMIMSVGGIVEHYKELEVLAREKNVRIFIPSGAICGIDGLKAAAFGKIKKAILTTKKPPKAFLGVPYVLKRKINLENLKEETVIFEGDASTAVRAFPQNINVAATLSIAGIGPKDTIVRIVASPNITQNIHEIEIESDAGRIITRTENVIHPDNPKTSYLAVLSAIATLKQILEPMKIGT